ncbi:MAG TPA: PRC-barrel domain-containing protein [Stellaceae bacterium]|nr:PRC-barrel domain-containing protein [Stellaceae bacterium]
MPDAATRETARLIASDKVEGTAVRRSNSDKVGAIERVMIDKRTGRVAYAVMSFGGILGMGSDYVALPWNVLRYNEALDAYELNMSDDQLRNAPVATTGFFTTGIADRQWEDNIHRHYGTAPYW